MKIKDFAVGVVIGLFLIALATAIPSCITGGVVVPRPTPHYEGPIAVGDVLCRSTENPFDEKHYAVVKAIKAGYIQYNTILNGELGPIDWSETEYWFRVNFPEKTVWPKK